jgi:hypothetical protein
LSAPDSDAKYTQINTHAGIWAGMQTGTQKIKPDAHSIITLLQKHV